MPAELQIHQRWSPTVTHCDTHLASLLTVVNCGDLELVQKMLAAGANVEGSSATGVTPLIAAVLRGLPEVVQVLLAAGANLPG